MQFAPVCRLSDGALAAAELQLRGPDGSAMATARALQRAARMMQEQAAIDDHKRRFATSDGARAVAELLPLLVRYDLDSVSELSSDEARVLERQVTSVLPETVARSPQRALAKVAKARAAGNVICVDGLGDTEQTATLLSLIEPDLIVTDSDMLQRNSDPDIARLAHVLAAHVERTHAVVIAEGVDSESLRLTAQTMGASFGIGALYPPVDDPADLEGVDVVPLPDAPVWSTPDPDLNTPYAIASRINEPRRGTKRLLIEMSKALEEQAIHGGAAVVLGTFQHAQFFTPLTAERWTEVSEHTGLTGVYGVGLSPIQEGRVHHAPLSPDDDLVNEWNVVVIGPHFAALLSARDQHSGLDDMDRTFDFVQSYDRVTVTQAVHSILDRFTG